jgi:hypothetical protein
MKEQDMNMHRAFLTPVALSVLLALAAVPAGAQDATTSAAATSDTTTSTTTTTTTSTSATVRFSTSSASLVSIRGVVSGEPESVAFSGQARIRSVLVRDPDFNRPSLLLTFDLSNISGVGSSTSAAYVIPGREHVQRRVSGSQVLEIAFPFLKSDATDLTSARAGVATFALDFDVETGVVTSAAGRVASPSF